MRRMIIYGTRITAVYAVLRLMNQGDIMGQGWIILIVVVAAMAVILTVLYFLGRKLQARQEEQQTQIDAQAQQIAMFIIDKKKLRLKDAGLPEVFMKQANFFTKRAKMPVIKAKIGSQVMNLICDAAIFDQVPVKKEVKATVSGIYITAVKGLRGKIVVEDNKKKGFFARISQKISEKGGAAPVK